MWAVIKQVDSKAEKLETWEALAQGWAKEGAVVWVDMEDPTAEQLRTLDDIIDLDDDVLDECLTGEPRPRIDEYETHLLVVSYGVIIPEGQTELESRKVAIFRGDRFLVTIHSKPSRSIASLRRRCEKNPDAVLSRGVNQMLYRLIDGMVDHYLTLLDQYEHQVDEFEEQSNDPEADENLLHAASRIRRHLIEVRRLVAAQRGLLEPLAEGDFDNISEELSRKFRAVRSHLMHAGDRVVGLQERLAGGIQNYNATVAKQTNDVVHALTLLSAVMLPMSLIAGIYGMNVPVWPPTDNPASFWAVLGVMGLMGVVMLVVFRRLRWL